MGNKKILIVEDEKTLREAMKIILTDAGYEIIEAADGISGMENSFKYKPDLILLDLNLPKMDGIEILKELRKDKKWGEKVPVIILTNLDNKSKVVEAAVEYVDDYYIKSDTDIYDIVGIVKDKLKKK